MPRGIVVPKVIKDGVCPSVDLKSSPAAAGTVYGVVERSTETCSSTRLFSADAAGSHSGASLHLGALGTL